MFRSPRLGADGFHFEILDVGGRLIRSGKSDGNRISIAGLEPDSYAYRLRSISGETFVGKFIVVR